MITYNHESFIERAIRSITSQKTSYSFELVIGEDASTDKTRAVCKRMEEKFPSFIRLLPNTGRLGMMPNFIRVIKAAKGKYIALCDGDDYWTGTYKLQKQVDFLEANPDYAICCHRIYVKKNNQKPKLYRDEYMPSEETDYDIEMMAKYGNLIATPSAVYRNKLFSSLPPWFDQSPIGDYVLHMINARYGKIRYFPDAMAVYRDHSKGAWGGQSIMTNAANMIKVIDRLLTEPFDDAVKKGLKEQLLKNKAVYLKYLMNEDWAFFCKEFNVMMDDDRAVGIALIEKMKTDIDAIYRSRTYKAVAKFKKIAKIST